MAEAISVDQFISLYDRLKKLEKQITQLTDLIDLYCSPITVIGQSESDFRIIQDTISGLSDKLANKLYQRFKVGKPFTGKINIYFPRCEKIKRIAPNAFSNRDYLYHVSGIDLSKLQHLQEIGECAFAKVGYLSEDFDVIDLRNLNHLLTIRQEAFYEAGTSSRKFENVKFCGNDNLINIGARSFSRIASKYIVNKGLTVDTVGGTFKNLNFIGSCAFANYKANYVYHKYIFKFESNKLKTIGPCVFRRDDNYGGVLPILEVTCPSTCEISELVFGMFQPHKIDKFFTDNRI